MFCYLELGERDLPGRGLGGMDSLGESGISLGLTTSLARLLYSLTTELCTDWVSRDDRDSGEDERENISGVSSTCKVSFLHLHLIGLLNIF